MDALVGLAMIACAAVLVGFRIAREGDRRRARRVLRDAPWLCADSRDGELVKATGVVRVRDHGDRLISPLSEARCVVCRTRVRARGGANLTAELRDTLQIRPFVLDRGGDGELVVDGVSSLLDVAPVRLSRFWFGRKLRLLRDLGCYGASGSSSEFEETVVEIGATITVAGTLALEVASGVEERGYRDPVLAVRLCGNHGHPIAIRVERGLGHGTS